MIRLSALFSFAAACMCAPLAALDELSEPVSSFDAGYYCDTVDRDGETSKPADVLAMLDKDAPKSNGYALANAVLISAAIDIAHASSDPAACRATIAQGKAKFEDTYAGVLAEVKKQRRHRYKRREPIRTIQQRIAQHWQEDQAGRVAYLNLRTDDRVGSDFWAARLSVANSRQSDEASKRYIEQVMDSYDWIDRKRFGGVYSDHAWILVQHADTYPEFQAEVLRRMEPYLENGGVKRKNYAYLFDRVAVNTGQLQLYGTQPTWECEDDGTMKLKPLKDPVTVNARRAEMGLNSVEAGLAEMTRSVCGG